MGLLDFAEHPTALFYDGRRNNQSRGFDPRCIFERVNAPAFGYFLVESCL
jgi:hypothetical protein